MKKTTLATLLIAASIVVSDAQGYFGMDYFSGSITVGENISSPALSSGWYCGSDFSVAAWMVTGSGAAEGSLVYIPTTLLQFIGNPTSAAGGPLADGAGYFTGGGAIDSGLAQGAATIQIRAWYNPGGNTYTYDNSPVIGKSTLYNINLVSSTDPTYSTLDSIGMLPFTVGSAAPVPEPSTFALAGLGLAGLLIFRRRK